MLTLVRHLVSIAALPFVAIVVIPVWLSRRSGIALRAGTGFIEVLSQIGGLLLLALGLLLFVSSVLHFATRGKGTLAPWDPPRRLVVSGPYRYVRNPMISGVMWILFGEALALVSRPHLVWALAFLAANLVYIPLVEEPRLARRFGESYDEYRRHVRRFVPRLRPWRPDSVEQV